jgi:hypothetical protein
MRILACTRESYPVKFPASYVLLHQSMALEELGNEVHYYNIDRHPLGITEYLQSFDFDLVLLDFEFLHSPSLVRLLLQFRCRQPIRVVGSLYGFPVPDDSAWEVVDFVFSPWKGETISALTAKFDLRYLPLAYNATLHRREPGPAKVGGVFAGNTTAQREVESREYLGALSQEPAILWIGPGFQEKHLDPFALGPVYAASRCLPNFHYSWEKSGDCILNERFWQTARCGIPVNDYSPLMDEVLGRSLLPHFCFADKRHWQERVRALSSGSETVDPGLLQQLDDALAGHSYHHRMKQLLEWLE